MPNLLPFAIISIIWSGSFLAAVSPFIWFTPTTALQKYAVFASVPFLFIFTFITLAGLISRIAKRGVKPGTFPRKPFDKVYFWRRVYGACWTQVFYFKPLYSVALTIPLFKKYLFRVFGYSHGTDFIVYPDTWIRDLPVLKIGSGAYLSNRATIGTNICLSNGHILVDTIEVEDNGLVGHLAILGPGAHIGKNSELGVGTLSGIRTKIGSEARIGMNCTINHGAVVGAKTKIGTSSYIGMKAVVGPGLTIPAGVNIAAGAVLNTKEDVEKYYHSETKKIEEHTDNLRVLFQEHIKHGV